MVFNGKFDLAWLRRYNIDFSSCRIWDCQLVHFILTGQKESYPSLNEVAEYYGLGTKLDQVKEEYWNNGIDTPRYSFIYSYRLSTTRLVFNRTDISFTEERSRTSLITDAKAYKLEQSRPVGTLGNGNQWY